MKTPQTRSFYDPLLLKIVLFARDNLHKANSVNHIKSSQLICDGLDLSKRVVPDWTI